MNRKQKLACLTMDVESDLHSPNPHIELFSNPHYFSPFKELIFNEEIPITAFLVTELLEKIPEVIERITGQVPIQFEVHSHSHNQDESDSAREIENAVRTFNSFFGNRPTGYRAPNGLISKEGLGRLVKAGFRYDSSIFPSIRMDEFGYNNLSMPVDPFVFTTPDPIIEFPLGVISKIRLVVSISYIKLFGFTTYEALIKLFGVPNTLIILCHPYDFTISHSLPNIKGWKRWAHARNASNALDILSRLIRVVKKLGYSFVSMNELVDQIKFEDLPQIDDSSHSLLL